MDGLVLVDGSNDGLTPSPIIAASTPMATTARRTIQRGWGDGKRMPVGC
jgi:hypothetical protein